MFPSNSDLQSVSRFSAQEAARIQMDNHAHYFAGCGQCGCEDSAIPEFCPCFSILSYQTQGKTPAIQPGIAWDLAQEYIHAQARPEAVLPATVVLHR